MSDKVSFLVIAGGSEASPVERLLAGGYEAITLDTVEKALAIDSLRPIVVATNLASLAERLRDYPVTVEPDPPGEFHFGRRLRALIARHAMPRVFYIGGGAGPLLSVEQLRRIAERVASSDRVLVTNNYYSCDFAAFAPASAIESIPLPDNDNNLGWLLGEQAGLPGLSPPRTAATMFDVDTPTDLLTLRLHPDVGGHAKAYLDSLDMDDAHLRATLPILTDRDREILIAGRVSSATWAYLEAETACRVRLLAEERGMRASGREARGETRSLLGELIDSLGVERFFAALSSMCDAAFLDTRVLFAHRGLYPSAPDRFYSDLRQPDRIGDPWIREFTSAAINAPMPVVLGGHSLVSGGMYALVEAAWRGFPPFAGRLIEEKGTDGWTRIARW
jgi:CTP:molybdopterin cytidylyltransferase MocA